MLQDIFDIIAKKYEFEKENRTPRANHGPYLQGLHDEIEEVHKEIKKNNTVYLEDELSDLLRDIFNTIYILEQEGYITSYQSVFHHFLEKYEKRVEDKINGISRETTKEEQKQKLIERHKQDF